MAGRKSKFTEKTRKKIYKAIRYGLSYKEAAQAAGVGVSTLKRWKAKALACSEADIKDQVDPKHSVSTDDEFRDFRDFWAKLEEAEPAGEYARAARIAKVGRGGYKTTEERVTVRDAITPHGAVVTLNEKTIITRKILPNWKADAWVLERRNPERWGRRESKHFHELKGSVDHKHEHTTSYDHDRMTAAEIEQLERILEQLPTNEDEWDLSILTEEDQEWLAEISERLKVS